ncbi:MAG: response regulator, partial [Lachnospiraceae bacterium]|nr:response regulator [Lachnospiraceae bacterium]
GIEYVKRKDIFDGNKIPRFLFVENKILNGEGKEAEELGVLVGNLNKTECEVVILYDPMIETVASSEYTLLNKPLYSLNFAQAINHEILSFESKQEFILNFRAPKAKVLVVDDNEMNRKVALGLMAPLQMQVDTANDGKQAVEKIMKNDYDLVFMDHMMPVMDGIEATKVIRGLEEEKYKKLPIVALTANAVSSARESFNEAGMNGFLAKPINTKELCKTIKKLLPEDLIEQAEEIKEEEVKEEDLPVIEGLNVKAGVENSGGLKLFTSLLADFYKLIDIKTTKIEKCLADGDIRDYTIEVHALKNTARMIGALELSDMFHALEDAGNAEDMETIERDTAKTLELYNSYKQVLQPYAVSENKNKEDVGTEEIEEVLTAIKEAMESFDLDSADAALKRLEEVRMPDKLREPAEKLSALVADVAMEDVISLCDNMIEILKEDMKVERNKEYSDNSGPGRVHNSIDKKQVRGKEL